MKNVNEKQLWDRVTKAIELLPYNLEMPLSLLSSFLWPNHDENDTRYWNRILCKVLREHGCVITRRGGRRIVSIPKAALARSKKRKARKKEEKPEHIMVAEAWPWP